MRRSVSADIIKAGLLAMGVPHRLIDLYLYLIQVYLLAFTEYQIDCDFIARITPICRAYSSGGLLPMQALLAMKLVLYHYDNDKVFEVIQAKAFINTKKGDIINKNKMRKEAALLFINGGEV